MRLISIESGEDEVAFHSNIPLLKLQSYTNYAYCAIDVRFGNRGIYESILNLEHDSQNLKWILDIERLNKMSIITGRMAMSIRKMQATFTFDLYLSVTAPNLAAKSTLEMILQIVCCIVDAQHWQKCIQEDVRRLWNLPFLQEPLKRSLEVSIYKLLEKLNDRASWYVLSYLVTNYLQQCLGTGNSLHQRKFKIRVAPRLIALNDCDKFSTGNSQDVFKERLRDWFHEYCKLNTAIYSIRDALKSLFENCQFKMQLYCINEDWKKLREAQLRAEVLLYENNHSFWVSFLGANQRLEPRNLTRDNDSKQFNTRLLLVNDKHIQY